MRCSVSAPASCDWDEYIGLLGDERGLLLRSEHQVSIALTDGGEPGEDAATDAEIGRAHMGAFLGAFKAQGDSSENFGCHRDPVQTLLQKIS